MSVRKAVFCSVCLVFCLVLLRPLLADGPPSPPMFNFFWFDDTNIVDAYGSPPLTVSNVFLTPSWDIYAVEISNTEPAILRFLETQTNGYPNILCDEGTAYMWFMPYWSSTNAGGTGPGTWARFLELGTFTTNASTGWWSLYTDPAGCNLYFSAQTNGAEALYLQAPIQFESNTWYQIALTYGSNSSALYLNDQLLTNGTGVTYWPSEAVRSNGFCVGSDGTGVDQVNGQIDFLIFCDYAWYDWEVTGWYESIAPWITEWQDSQSMQGGLEMNLFKGVENGSGLGPPITCTNFSLLISRYQSTNLLLTICDTQVVTQQCDLLYSLNLNIPIQWSWLATSASQQTNFVIAPPIPSPLFFSLIKPGDTDNDGMPNGWEAEHGLDPETNDAAGDPDGDGLTNLQEYLAGTNPRQAASFGIHVTQPKAESVLP